MSGREINRLDAAAQANFWSKVQKTPTCWLWTARVGADGDGDFKLHRGGGSKVFSAHRVSYALLVGEPDVGLVLDHICRVRHCVNPEHLRLVDNRTNVLAGIGPTAINARKTHCKRGHEFTPENTYRPPTRPSQRWCRACRTSKQIARSRARNEAIKGQLTNCPTCSAPLRPDGITRHLKNNCPARQATTSVASGATGDVTGAQIGAQDEGGKA